MRCPSCEVALKVGIVLAHCKLCKLENVLVTIHSIKIFGIWPRTDIHTHRLFALQSTSVGLAHAGSPNHALSDLLLRTVHVQLHVHDVQALPAYRPSHPCLDSLNEKFTPSFQSWNEGLHRP